MWSAFILLFLKIIHIFKIIFINVFIIFAISCVVKKCHLVVIFAYMHNNYIFVCSQIPLRALRKNMFLWF